jgi:hypothetical protein
MPADVTIQRCGRAAAIAQDLIGEHYPSLGEAKLLWLLTSAKAPCRPKVLGAVDRYLSRALELEPDEEPDVADGHDLLCLINDDLWTFLDTVGHRIAYVDHMLAHVSRTVSARNDVVWHIDKHPVEEFPAVVGRHGLWTAKLRDLAAAAGHQLPLPEPRADLEAHLVADGAAPEDAAAAGAAVAEVLTERQPVMPGRRRRRGGSPAENGTVSEGQPGEMLYSDVRQEIAAGAGRDAE